jgi:hypothetical protein
VRKITFRFMEAHQFVHIGNRLECRLYGGIHAIARRPGCLDFNEGSQQGARAPEPI